MATRHQIEVDGRELSVSNLDKPLFPESGFTKGEVISYYAAVADAILPHLRDRPLTLKRYPDGIHEEHFYEKNAPSHRPPWVKTFAVPRSEGGGDINYVLCNDRATLIWATNLADIEKHVLLARAPDLHRPTSLVFDLDPGDPADIFDCAEIALELKKVFGRFGLESFVKVSGSKGLHLSVPLNTDVSYEVTQPFAKTIAELMQKQMPDRVVSDMAKRLRGGKVLVDWSQNSDFKTTVAVYAMRAKHGEPFISLPVTWEELARALKRRNDGALFFGPKDAQKRLKKLGDLFAPVLKLKQQLPAAFTKALAKGPAPKLSTWQKHRKGSGSMKDKSLREYAAKRDHNQTSEPPAARGKKTGKKGVHRFVIQKHEASHLHYDWRLEMQGVLRSWAVPKGPPLELRKAHLAMHVEDHPLEYADFEGTIPPGNYGAGTVMIWDQGTYEDITGNPTAAFHQGKMHVVMHGKKLKGEWILVKDRREEDSNKWLLIKAGESQKLSAKADNTSSVSKRSMRQIAKAADRQWQSNRSAGGKPNTRSRKLAFVKPMQCKPVTKLPDDDSWMFEIKFDGYRCLALKSGEKVRLLSRNEKTLNARFPGVVKGVGQLEGDFILDGEVVALDERGRPSFQLLQNSQSDAVPVHFYGFDLLHYDGQDLKDEPIEKRRALLESIMTKAGEPLRLSPLLTAPPNKILEAMTKMGLEGVIGKRPGSKYEPGERTGAWIKMRVDLQQEFVIGGYVPGARGFDSLIVGVYEDKRLHFVAKVRNGFVPRIRDEISAQLKPLKAARCPFVNLPETKKTRWGQALTAEKMKECAWVKPKLVCQVGFVEWTEGGDLRHEKFIAMRDDKPARAVVRET